MKKTQLSLASLIQGQTILESLMTLLFIAFAVIALIRFQNYLAYDNSLSSQMADATQLALSRTEALHDFQVMNTTTGFNAYSDISSGSTTAITTSTTYTINTVVTPFTSPTYKLAEVTVSWTDRRGNPQSLKLVTIIAGVDPAFSAAVM